MTTPILHAFALPARLHAKAAAALIDADERHLQAIARSLDQQVAELQTRLDAARRAPGGGGTEALERDQEIHRLSARLRTLRRYGLDLCLGRMVPADGGEPVYLGRLGLADAGGARLLVDWRSPAAEPFFGATHGNPMGLVSRRRYRWTGGRITDYWDEVFTADGLADAAEQAALDDQSAFIASLSASRSSRMRDVLGTIAADQDAIIRAPARGALVVDGGPGTGKTLVALHRAAYLRYADPQLGYRRGGVLVVGPHHPYLEYVGDVLPSLGEEGVQTATLRDLVPEGSTAAAELDAAVAALKGSVAMVRAIEPAVRFYEEPPTTPLDVETPWGDARIEAADWAEAFATPEDGTPHNEARDVVWDALLDILVDQFEDADEEADPATVRRGLARLPELASAVNAAWPVLEATDVVGDLWSVPAYLRMAAPWLSPEQARTLRRAGTRPWTTADLPLLDAARLRLGDPELSRVRRRREAEIAARRSEMADVVTHLVESDDSELQVMSMLRVPDMQDALIDTDALPTVVADRLAGPFGHVVVDEAQELTDAQWQMILARCPSRSLTIVGDRAQARAGFAETWQQRLQRVGLREIAVSTLGVNYRTPEEVMAAAEPVIRAELPDANVPTSIRSTGLPVERGDAADLEETLERWLAEHDGVACVIASPRLLRGLAPRERVQLLTPELAKGLEFDLVVLVEPEGFGRGLQGAVDRYVAMTRATQQLIVLSSS